MKSKDTKGLLDLRANMSNRQQNVVSEEKSELEIKIQKLAEFKNRYALFFEQTFNESTMCQEEWERERDRETGLTNAHRFHFSLTSDEVEKTEGNFRVQVLEDISQKETFSEKCKSNEV